MRPSTVSSFWLRTLGLVRGMQHEDDCITHSRCLNVVALKPKPLITFCFSCRFRNFSTVIAVWLVCLYSLIGYAAAADPVFDPSTTMRLVLVPADATVGAVIFRIRASDDEFDYPLTFELMGDSSSSTVQIDSLPCTKYNSVCQANVVLRRRLEPGRYYDFQVSVKDTKGGMAQQGCSITATNFTTPTDLIFPKRTSIIMVSEVRPFHIFIN